MNARVKYAVIIPRRIVTSYIITSCVVPKLKKFSTSFPLTGTLRGSEESVGCALGFESVSFGVKYHVPASRNSLIKSASKA